MRFLVDAQLPPALARELTRAGHHAEHVIDIGPADATDEELWLWAAQHGAVIVTKDEDFAAMSVLDGAGAPAVVWVRSGNVRRAQLIAWFVPLTDQIVEMVSSGHRLIELR